jgi:hypothetical protein
MELILRTWADACATLDDLGERLGVGGEAFRPSVQVVATLIAAEILAGVGHANTDGISSELILADGRSAEVFVVGRDENMLNGTMLAATEPDESDFAPFDEDDYEPVPLDDADEEPRCTADDLLALVVFEGDRPVAMHTVSSRDWLEVTRLLGIRAELFGEEFSVANLLLHYNLLWEADRAAVLGVNTYLLEQPAEAPAAAPLRSVIAAEPAADERPARDAAGSARDAASPAESRPAAGEAE